MHERFGTFIGKMDVILATPRLGDVFTAA